MTVEEIKVFSRRVINEWMSLWNIKLKSLRISNYLSMRVFV
jgi:hypothetical protein